METWLADDNKPINLTIFKLDNFFAAEQREMHSMLKCHISQLSIIKYMHVLKDIIVILLKHAICATCISDSYCDDQNLT